MLNLMDVRFVDRDVDGDLEFTEGFIDRDLVCMVYRGFESPQKREEYVVQQQREEFILGLFTRTVEVEVPYTRTVDHGVPVPTLRLYFREGLSSRVIADDGQFPRQE